MLQWETVVERVDKTLDIIMKIVVSVVIIYVACLVAKAITIMWTTPSLR